MHADMLSILSAVNASRNVPRGGRKRMTKLAKVNFEKPVAQCAYDFKIVLRSSFSLDGDVPLLIVAELRVPGAPCERKHANRSLREMFFWLFFSSRIVRFIFLKKY